jgi:4'-phosphopantetheinyl transferase
VIAVRQYAWQAGVDNPVPQLQAGQLHLWHLDMDAAAHPLAAYTALLSDDEHQRSSQYRMALSQRRYVVRRAVLRRLLAGYMALPPSAIRFRYAERGKPLLAGGPDAAKLHFNVSDTGSRALMAFTRLGAVGVDLEAALPIPDMAQVAERWFSAHEQAQLAQLDGAAQVRGFYLAWTRKEALVKAEGTGIARELARFSVALLPGEPARLLHAESPLLATFDVIDIAMAEPYVAACAVAAALNAQ